jgi:hypothetical protein
MYLLKLLLSLMTKLAITFKKLMVLLTGSRGTTIYESIPIRFFFRSSMITSPVITLPQDYSSLPYYLSFNAFGFLTIVFYIFSFVLCLIVPYMLYITYTYIIDKMYRLRFIMILLTASIIFFALPLLLLVVSALTAIPSLFFYLHFHFSIRRFDRIFSSMVSFLYRIGIITFINRLYSTIFLVISDIQFLFFTNGLFMISFGYIAISRFYLFFVITNNLSLLDKFHYVLLSLSLFLCLCIWALRLLINLSFFVVSSLQTYDKPILLFGEEVPIPPSNPSSPPIPPSTPTPPPSPIRHFSLWNSNRHTHSNYYSYARPQWYYMGNLTLGVCTLGLGCVGAYVAYQMWITTHESNLALDRNSQAMHRQSDQTDLDAGRITEEDYMNKWHPNRSSAQNKDISEMSPQEYERLSNIP